ncbi:hypothetical protein NQ318_004801 [Aromia moschata]|uniref:DUF4817 domain-containing protein n=1 Tax=Aromia moschata TaxID=1265417 RepID=A0AAV8XPZ1_9CUCU|nr:hypothetical protein NQ318_004801 [Aromia moschata]
MVRPKRTLNQDDPPKLLIEIYGVEQPNGIHSVAPLYSIFLENSETLFVLQFREMVYLTEMHKITILQMIGYGDRTRTQAEVIRLFQEKYPELPPISQVSGTWTCTEAKEKSSQ